MCECVCMSERDLNISNHLVLCVSSKKCVLRDCGLTYIVFVRYSEAAAHAVATLAEATLQGGGQIVLAETAAAVGALAGVQDATGTYSDHILSSTQRKKTQRQITTPVFT